MGFIVERSNCIRVFALFLALVLPHVTIFSATASGCSSVLWCRLMVDLEFSLAFTNVFTGLIIMLMN